jgi:glycosyltransferase involved in cell wall biosynthesis
MRPQEQEAARIRGRVQVNRSAMKIAIITGSLAPYMSRFYSAFAERYGVDITVLQCATAEPGRQWRLPETRRFRLISLPGIRRHRSDVSHIYFNPAVIRELARLKPDRILIDSFSPTMILAALYGIATRTAYVLGLEGDRDIDPGERSLPHALARRFFARWAYSGSCTSEAAREMMISWGLPRERTAIVPHAGSWPAPASIRDFDDRPYDLLLCGTLNDRKNPLFIADVVDRLAAEGWHPAVRIVGDGTLRDVLANRLAAAGVKAKFDGYLQQEAIINAYQSAKVLVFPTKADTWGLVANEALLCGTPVLASPHAVSSRELVGAFGTGLVRELDPAIWAAALKEMLGSREVWRGFRHRRDEAMARFSLESAMAGYSKVHGVSAPAGKAAPGKRPGRRTHIKRSMGAA